MKDISIYDTTLRDGSQGEGVTFSREDKVRIAQRLDALGIHYIEGGWPGSNPKDIRFFRQIQGSHLKQAKVAAFGSTRRPGLAPGSDPNLQAVLAGRGDAEFMQLYLDQATSGALSQAFNDATIALFLGQSSPEEVCQALTDAAAAG